jgi:membrane protein YdbS with pleckstrin-like domain
MQTRQRGARELAGPAPHARIVPRTRHPLPAVSSRRTFRGKLEDERVIAIRRPSRLLAIGPCLPLAAGVLGILLWHGEAAKGNSTAFLAAVALAVISAPWAVKFVWAWVGQVFILSNQRVLIQHGLIQQHIEQVELVHVSQVIVERPNFLQMLCGLGTVVVRPTGTPLRLRHVSRPRDLADMILAVREQKGVPGVPPMPQAPELHNKRLQSAFDSLDQPEPEPLVTPTIHAPLGGFLQRKLPIRLIANESVVEIVYRHWIVLLRRELPALVVAVGAALCGLGLHALGVTGASVPLIILGGIAAALLYTVLTYIDWADDVFVLTSHRVIDIDRIFFLLAEYSNDAPYGKIQDVRVEQGFWGHLFGYGSILVETAGRDQHLAMHDIPDAKGLMNRIFAQVEQVRERELAIVKRRQRLEAYHGIAKVLDNLMREVPDLVGLSLLSAAARAHAAGLRLTVAGERPMGNTPAGTVLAQSPQAGSTLLSEGEVQVLLSARNELVSERD